jgi:hypothetical protein
MIAYFDTSAALKLLVAEAGTAAVRTLWSSADTAVSSVLLYPEGRAALAAAHRAGRISDLSRLRRSFDGLVSRVALVEAHDAIIRRAGDLAEEFALRGYDAVHVASAESVAGPESVFVTADIAQRTAAGRLGLAVGNLSA